HDRGQDPAKQAGAADRDGGARDAPEEPAGASFVPEAQGLSRRRASARRAEARNAQSLIEVPKDRWPKKNQPFGPQVNARPRSRGCACCPATARSRSTRARWKTTFRATPPGCEFWSLSSSPKP